MPQVVEQKKVKIGDYTLSSKIGQGGIAEIYKGHQESLGRDVAIKILSTKVSDDPDIVRRFERESMVIAGLSHPNIVSVIDKGKAGNRYYFVMEYIDGTSLREVIDSDHVALSTKIDMIVQVCKALDYAHKNGVIHRDIKPANILIDRQGNALVADFGIAQIVGTPEADMTSSDVIMGTLSYMSPEQKVSSTNIDQTTDIYALGVILYEILVSKKPLGRFKMPSELKPELQYNFDGIIQKCLAQEAKDRFQSAVEMKDAILESTGGAHTEGDTDQFKVSGSESFMGKCRYLDTIKETKFGSTILVENRVSKRLYVIKKHSKGEVGRKEAKLLSSLKHKNIINIHGAGGDKRSTVIISEYAQGGSLADRMVRRYHWEKAFKIGLDIASGLDFAHKNSIIHGNLRPSNVLFDAKETVRISDFGLPQHYDEAHRKNWYRPPELKMSRQGDIYALGVILHQMITGRNPTHDASNHLRLDDVRDHMALDACDMLSKLLAIRVANRYKSAEEFILDWDDLEQRRKDTRPKITSDTRSVLPPPKPETPLWMWIALSISVAIAVALALYVAGFVG